MFDYEKYEEECEKIRQENEEYLRLFREYLIQCGLSDNTIKRHMRNADFYINTFMLYEDANRMPLGVSSIDMFLDDFFIRKCGWSTPGTIRTMATSIKKFYYCMYLHGKIEKSDYDELCETIKDEMPTWRLHCAMYNDTSMPNPFRFM